jgi:hypothetical protein
MPRGRTDTADLCEHGGLHPYKEYEPVESRLPSCKNRNLGGIYQLLVTTKVYFYVVDIFRYYDGGDMFLRNASTYKSLIAQFPTRHFHSHRRENLKSYIALTGCAL